ncbi:MAG: aspartate aminotransferase family protein [Anaerolineae bacterium]
MSIEVERQHTSGLYPKRDVVIVRGLGARVCDAAGREYIDCVGGHGVAIVGHCHPRVVAAVRSQAEQLITCPEIFYNNRRAELLARLAALAPAGLTRAFLCNSGTEAVEAALKFARLATGRPGIVAAMRGFHGRTFGALAATWEPKYRDPFLPLVPEFSHVPFDNLERLEQAVGDGTAAVLLEVVQGEGGVRPCSPGYIRGALDICRSRGALLIVDEVQTGCGRTGRLWACEHEGVAPDLLCLGKGLAGGVPMGAVLIGERIPPLPQGVHGSTFGGNPLACAAALATLDSIVGEELPERAARLGAWLLERLQAIPSSRIREVRGRGLMVGIELKEKVQPYLVALQERGVLALPAGPTVLRLLPPLVIEEGDLEQVVAAIKAVLA